MIGTWRWPVLPALLGLALGCGDPGVAIGPVDPPPAPPEEPSPPVPLVAVIHLADADGGNVRPLVAGERPAWSPDGRRLAFQRDGQIHLIGVEGTGETRLAEGREPSWEPAGARIAYTSADGIATMRHDGSDPTLLLRHGFRDDTYAEWDMGVGKPAWSPDGNRIALEHLGDGDLTPAQVFVIAVADPVPVRLTPTQGMQFAESDPSWSPDGTEIVFWSFGHGIAAGSPAGQAPRRIYESQPAVVYGAKPVWSPDGSTILFRALLHQPGGSALWEVQASGGVPRELIPDAAEPAWAPDGSAIAFVRMVPELSLIRTGWQPQRSAAARR